MEGKQTKVKKQLNTQLNVWDPILFWILYQWCYIGFDGLSAEQIQSVIVGVEVIRSGRIINLNWDSFEDSRLSKWKYENKKQVYNPF